MFSKRHVAVLFGAAVLVTGCGRPAAAPPTDVMLKPEIIGVVVRWEYGSQGGTLYTLDSGDVVELGGLAEDGMAATPRISESQISFADSRPGPAQDVSGPSVLILAGHGPDGKLWYAAAPAAGSGSRCGGYEMRGEGIYDEGSVLHFSSGLIVAKASGFSTDVASTGGDAFPLNSADRLCLDATGTAIYAEIWYPY